MRKSFLIAALYLTLFSPSVDKAIRGISNIQSVVPDIMHPFW